MSIDTYPVGQRVRVVNNSVDGHAIGVIGKITMAEYDDPTHTYRVETPGTLPCELREFWHPTGDLEPVDSHGVRLTEPRTD